MAHFAKIVAVAMVAAMGVTFLVTQPLWSHTRPLERPAGCHEHGSKAPTPRPASSECCVVGHNTALPQTAHSFEPVLLNDRIELVGDAPLDLLAVGMEKLFISSGDPPGSTPLRI